MANNQCDHYTIYVYPPDTIECAFSILPKNQCVYGMSTQAIIATAIDNTIGVKAGKMFSATARKQ